MYTKIVYICNTFHYQVDSRTGESQMVPNTDPTTVVYSTRQKASQWLFSTSRYLCSVGGNGWHLAQSACPIDTSDAVAIYYKEQLRYILQYNAHTIVS